VVVVGDVGSTDAYHVGDEAMLMGLLDAVAADGMAVDWTVVSSDPSATSSRLGVASVRDFGFAGCHTVADLEPMLNRLDDILTAPVEQWGSSAPPEWATTLRAVVESDALIIAGGGNLSHAWPALVCERVALIRAARRVHRTIAMTGQSLGPFFGSRTRRLVEEILDACKLVGVRERHSVNVARALGVPPHKIRLCFDDAAALASAAPTSPAVSLDRPFIAVTINAFAGTGPEAGSLESLGRQLLALAAHTGARVVFVPHVGDIASNRGYDIDIAQRLSALDATGEHFVTVPLPSPLEAVWYCERAAVVISSRYHPIVFGASAATPSLLLWQDGYTRAKGEGALNLVGQMEWSLSLHDACSGDLLPTAIRLWTQRRGVGAALQSIGAHIRGSSRRHLTSVVRSILSDDEAPASSELDLSDPSASYLTSLVELADLELDERDRVASTAAATITALEQRFTIVEEYARTVERRATDAERYAADLERALTIKSADVEIMAARIAELER